MGNMSVFVTEPPFDLNGSRSTDEFLTLAGYDMVLLASDQMRRVYDKSRAALLADWNKNIPSPPRHVISPPVSTTDQHHNSLTAARIKPMSQKQSETPLFSLKM